MILRSIMQQGEGLIEENKKQKQKVTELKSDLI